MAEIVARNCRFHIQKLGKSGEHVVFLHGMVWDNLSSWFFSAAPHVASVARVLLYDMRGHGKSERTPTGYRVEESVEDLKSILDETEFGTGAVHLVGNSFGGLLAIAFALKHPEMVASLVLVDAPLADDDTIQMMIDSLRMEGAEREREITRLFTHWLGRQTDPKNTLLADGAKKLVYETSLIDDLDASRRFSDAELSQLAVPVLAIYGENSNLRTHGEHLTRLFPKCDFQLMEGGSHVILWEFSTQIAARIVDWIGVNRHKSNC